MQSEVKNISNKNQEYIPLREAAEVLNTSPDYVNVLVRRGKLQAVKLGRNWFTNELWLNEYQKSVGRLPASESEKVITSNLEDLEKSEFEGLKTKLVLEKQLLDRLAAIESRIGKDAGIKLSENFKTWREKDLAFQNLISVSEIKLEPRFLGDVERKIILDSVNERLKSNDSLAFEKATRQFGILKNLRERSGLKFGVASGLVIVLLTAAIGFTNLDISRFYQDYGGQSKFKNLKNFQASIISDAFKNFPTDFPLFSDWVKNNAVSIFKPSLAPKFTTDSLESGKSKIAKTTKLQEIKTLDEAEALDSFVKEEISLSLAQRSGATEGQQNEIATSGNFTLLENRLSVVELDLAEQKALTNSELSLQKKTILGTLETLIGISKFIPSHPISSIVVQGSPATLTTYSVAPSTHSGFDRLSANYLNLSNNATVNGSLTVKSGGTFDTFSVSGNSTLTGNTTIGGTLSVTGDTTLGNISVGNATTTGLTVQGGTSLGSLSAGAITVTSCSG
ncbi:MAG: hypothetical protein AAB648_01935, partial [Patescibacteria group bacterium]